MGRNLTEFQSVFRRDYGNERPDAITMTVLREVALRLAQNQSYPQLIPIAGQLMWDVLNEIDALPTVEEPAAEPVEVEVPTPQPYVAGETPVGGENEAVS